MISTERLVASNYFAGFRAGSRTGLGQAVIIFKGLFHEMPEGHYEEHESNFTKGLNDGTHFREVDTGEQRVVGSFFADIDVTPIVLSDEEWQKVSLLTIYAEEIARYVFPDWSPISPEHPTFEERRNEFAHGNFFACLRNLIIERHPQPEDGTVTIYILRNCASALILAADAVLTHPELSETIYRGSGSLWAQFFEEVGKDLVAIGDATEDELYESFKESLVIDWDLLGKIHKIIENSPKDMTLASYL